MHRLNLKSHRRYVNIYRNYKQTALNPQNQAQNGGVHLHPRGENRTIQVNFCFETFWFW